MTYPKGTGAQSNLPRRLHICKAANLQFESCSVPDPTALLTAQPDWWPLMLAVFAQDKLTSFRFTFLTHRVSKPLNVMRLPRTIPQTHYRLVQ